MAHDKGAVRKILDKVKAEGRTSLTAPEGKLVCDAYGIAAPKEGIATSAAEASKIASSMGFVTSAKACHFPVAFALVITTSRCTG